MSREASESLLTIGQVVEHLQRYSSEITVSKLRFWEHKGLITPQRTPGGHRLYSADSVERLRFIVELRIQRRLPLSTVKAVLKRLEQDPAYRFVAIERSLYAEDFDPAFRPLSRSEAAAQAGLTEEQVTELEEAGLIVSCPKTGSFDEEAVQMLPVLAGLLDLGLTPQDLAFYVHWAQKVVEYEHTLFAGLCQNGDGEAGTETEAERMARYRRFRELVGPLQRLLYLSYLRQAVHDLLDKG